MGAGSVAMIVIMGAKIIANGLFRDVQFMGNPVNTPCGNLCLIALSSSKVIFMTKFLVI